jgi:acyl dehydratase
MSTESTFDDFEVGQRFETGGRTATEADIRMFVGATGSTDRIHVDHDYAADHPLVDDVVCHGTLALAITDGLLADEIAQDAALAMNYGHDGVRYLGPVYPGDTLTATAEVTETREKEAGWGVVVTDVEVKTATTRRCSSRPTGSSSRRRTTPTSRGERVAGFHR